MSYMVRKIFYEFLNVNFSNFITVFTDRSFSPLSTGYAFYMQTLHNISFTNNLPPSSSTFTTECYAIIAEALTLISNFDPDKYNT